MKYFLGNVSKKAARLVDWSDKLWERRFHASAVLDPQALEGILKYILAHGVKEGLVRRVDEWPGATPTRRPSSRRSRSPRVSRFACER